ncbi:MAG: hypothetical protein GY866_23755 [Proteobacteria bacterium]|nr:hypothetical protein [Pseudomonadota bacterium]
MTQTTQTGSDTSEKSDTFDFGGCCGNFEKMSEMMADFFGKKEKTFDCREMMRKMCCGKKKAAET